MRIGLLLLGACLLAGCEKDTAEATAPLATRAQRGGAIPHAALARGADGSIYFAHDGTLERLSDAGEVLETLDDVRAGYMHSVTAGADGTVAYATQIEQGSSLRSGKLIVRSASDRRELVDLSWVDGSVALDGQGVWLSERDSPLNSTGSLTHVRFEPAEDTESASVGFNELIGGFAVEPDRLWTLVLAASAGSKAPRVVSYSRPSRNVTGEPFELPGEPFGIWSTDGGVRIGIKSGDSYDLYDSSKTKVGTFGSLTSVRLLATTERYAYAQRPSGGTDEAACIGGSLLRIDLATGNATELDATTCEIHAALAYGECVLFVEAFDAVSDVEKWPYKLKRICR